MQYEIKTFETEGDSKRVGFMVNNIDEHKDGGYVTPAEIDGDFITYISRIREDKTQKNSINMWVVSDNLLKGAALNAVQIAQLLCDKYLK